MGPFPKRINCRAQLIFVAEVKVVPDSLQAMAVRSRGVDFSKEISRNREKTWAGTERIPIYPDPVYHWGWLK
jgi:hypothetical protein